MISGMRDQVLALAWRRHDLLVREGAGSIASARSKLAKQSGGRLSDLRRPPPQLSFYCINVALVVTVWPDCVNRRR